MEIYDFSVAPGKVAEIHCEGTYVYFSAGSAGGADATISLKHDAAGSRVLLLPGQGFRMGEGLIGRRWLVSNYAGAATITGRLVIGSGAIDDNRITGSVEVIDGEKARTMAGGSLVGGIALAGSAGVSPYAQLWNPAASGKNLIVQQASLSGNIAGTVYVHWATAALATDTTAVGVRNKKQGLAVGVGQMRTELKVGGPPDYFFTMAAAANQFVPWTPKGNLVIPPGAGLTVAYMASGANLFFNAEWFEEGI